MKLNIILLFMAFSSLLSGQTKEIVYHDENQLLKGQLVLAKKPLKDNPGILILPAWMGISDHTKEVATQLSSLGYHAFVADIYGDGYRPKSTEEAAKRSSFFKTNPDQYQHRIFLALQELVKQGANPDKIVVIGYCFGGTGALEAARAQLNVQGVVSFHGGLAKEESRKTKRIITKVLVLHGADDPFVPPVEVESFKKEMKLNNADWQMVYYADAVHAFTEKAAGTDRTNGAAYNEKADKRSFEHLLIFLKEVLQ
jgi:dienelactone hydrolase